MSNCSWPTGWVCPPAVSLSEYLWVLLKFMTLKVVLPNKELHQCIFSSVHIPLMRKVHTNPSGEEMWRFSVQNHIVAQSAACAFLQELNSHWRESLHVICTLPTSTESRSNYLFRFLRSSEKLSRQGKTINQIWFMIIIPSVSNVKWWLLEYCILIVIYEYSRSVPLSGIILLTEQNRMFSEVNLWEFSFVTWSKICLTASAGRLGTSALQLMCKYFTSCWWMSGMFLRSKPIHSNVGFFLFIHS